MDSEVRAAPEGVQGPSRLRILGPADLTGLDGQPIRSGSLQPKRLVLLAYLAMSPRRAFVRRDTLLGLFWPELAGDQARHALRQALHQLRSVLGRDAIVGRGEGEVAASEALVWCDAGEFTARLAAGDREGAIALYRGALLEGVFVSDGASELEHWMEGERAGLRRLAVRTAVELADGARQRGDLGTATGWARRALLFDPDDEAALRSLMQLLEEHGDRTGALRAYADYARRLEQEYGAEPSAPTQALRGRLGAATPGAADAPGPVVRAPAGVPAGPGDAAGPSRSSGRPARKARTLLLLGAAVVTGAFAIFGLARPQQARSGPPVIAVGAIEQRGVSHRDSLPTAILRSLLATDLARLSGVQVLSQARVHEVLARSGLAGDSREHLATAARRAGADDVLEGVLSRSGNGLLRLELRRRDLATGEVRGSVTAEASDLFGLSARALHQIASEYDVPAPGRDIGPVTSRSLLAQRQYETGLRAMSRGAVAEAARNFQAALEEDSTFVAPAYYLSVVGMPTSEWRVIHGALNRAARTADGAPERERLLVRSLVARLTHDPALVAISESLATRYPAEPEGPFALGYALAFSGDFLGAIPYLRRAIALDSAIREAAPPEGAPCRSCEAAALLVTTYLMADSLPAAERAVRALDPQIASPLGPSSLAWVLDVTGRRDQALAGLLSAPNGPRPGGTEHLEFQLASAIRAGELEEAEGLIAAALASRDTRVRGVALWWDLLLARTKGRTAEAVRAGRRLCAVTAQEPEEPSPADHCALGLGAALLDAGRPDDAARGVRSALRVTVADSIWGAGMTARRTALLLFHLGRMRAAAGDTLNLLRLADSVESWGRRSAYGRDRRLHHHLRGLLHVARGRDDLAVVSFSRAIWSPSLGFTRTNHELARALLRLDRPAEAVAALEPALRGTISSNGAYLTQTELHALLAEAHWRAGHGDRALDNLRWAEAAWRDADPPFRARLDTLRRLLSP